MINAYDVAPFFQNYWGACAPPAPNFLMVRMEHTSSLRSSPFQGFAEHKVFEKLILLGLLVSEKIWKNDMEPS